MKSFKEFLLEISRIKALQYINATQDKDRYYKDMGRIDSRLNSFVLAQKKAGYAKAKAKVMATDKKKLTESLVEKGISMAALKNEARKSPCKLARFVHTDGNIFAGSAHDTTHDMLLTKAYGTHNYPYGNNLHGYLKHELENDSFTYDFSHAPDDHPIHDRLKLFKIKKRPPPEVGKYYSNKEDNEFFPKEVRW